MSVPQSGELFERWYDVEGVMIGLLAEVEISGEEIHLRDIAVYPIGSEPAMVGAAALLRAFRTELIPELRAAGFVRLRITGRRLSGPRPRRTVDITVDLPEAP